MRAQLCTEVLCSTSVYLSPDLGDCNPRLPIRIHFIPRIENFVQLRHFMQDNSLFRVQYFGARRFIAYSVQRWGWATVSTYVSYAPPHVFLLFYAHSKQLRFCILKPSSNRSPNIFILFQKVKIRYTKRFNSKDK